MNVRKCVAVLAAIAGASGHDQQPANLVVDVRAAVARQDCAEGERLIATLQRRGSMAENRPPSFLWPVDPGDECLRW
jgi:hypothetical protein